MKRVFLYAFLLLLTGCVYSAPEPVYYERAYLEPLPASLVIGPPERVPDPSPELEKKTGPLPPVLVIPGRNLYFHRELYYYRSNSEWYFSTDRAGPWYRLKSDYYPKETAKEPLPKPFERVTPRRPDLPYSPDSR